MSLSIIATVANSVALSTLVKHGRIDALRFNASHQSIEQLLKLCSQNQKLPVPFPVYIDLQGGKIRVSAKQPVCTLRQGQFVSIGCSSGNQIQIEDYALKALRRNPPQRISIDDGKILLDDVKLISSSFKAHVLRGNIIRPNKGLNISPHPFVTHSINARDQAIVRATQHFSFVRYALSFVSTIEEVSSLKKLCDRPVAAKLERPLSEAVVRGLAEVADEMWLCRGDLGAQIGLDQLGPYYLWYKSMVRGIKQSKSACRHILAGEVMDHMIKSRNPTRSEICHLADALETGFDGIVLSNETAYGRHPVALINIVKDIGTATTSYLQRTRDGFVLPSKL